MPNSRTHHLQFTRASDARLPFTLKMEWNENETMNRQLVLLVRKMWLIVRHCGKAINCINCTSFATHIFARFNAIIDRPLCPSAQIISLFAPYDNQNNPFIFHFLHSSKPAAYARWSHMINSISLPTSKSHKIELKNKNGKKISARTLLHRSRHYSLTLHRRRIRDAEKKKWNSKQIHVRSVRP